MRVEVEIEEIAMEGDYGDVDGICATCSRCGHTVEVYGTSDASVRRACATLREECPEDEENFYEADA